MIQKMLLNAAINALSKNFKLGKVLKYVEEPNELDRKVKKLEKNKVALEQKVEKILNELDAIKAHLKKLDKAKYKLKVPKK
tara:strand:- start:985 stop:1227 length:243 start_codon:yes stop_codon:yes gene_type:complete